MGISTIPDYIIITQTAPDIFQSRRKAGTLCGKSNAKLHKKSPKSIRGNARKKTKGDLKSRPPYAISLLKTIS